MIKGEKTIPANGKIRLGQALERLVQLYDAWGKPEKALEWKAKRDNLSPAAAPPSK